MNHRDFISKNYTYHERQKTGMNIGLIGAQNSHARHFCNAINGTGQWPDIRIRFVYGADDPTECTRLCPEFGIEACESEDEVIAKSDAVVVTYRKGSEHYAPVMAAIRAGKPVFNVSPLPRIYGRQRKSWLRPRIQMSPSLAAPTSRACRSCAPSKRASAPAPLS